MLDWTPLLLIQLMKVAQAANLEKPVCDIQSQDWKSKIVICLKKGLLPLG